jgi:hypothetical protein
MEIGPKAHARAAFTKIDTVTLASLSRVASGFDLFQPSWASTTGVAPIRRTAMD